MRLSMSRPSPSAPSQCSALGGACRARKFDAIGSNGAITSARRARMRKNAMIPPPISAARLRRKRLQNIEPVVCLVIANPRIEKAIRDVYKKVRGGHDECHDQQATLHDWEILRDNRLHHHATHTWPGEHGFYNN